MKTIFKVIMLLVCASFVNTIMAAGNLKINIVPLDDEKAIVAISTLTHSDFSISVADNQNRIVYFNEAKNLDENYRKVYDFSGLADGKYKITVTSSGLTTEREFEKKLGNVNVGMEKTMMEPFFSYKDDLLRCTYLNFMNEKVTLKFYSGNELVYSKEVGDQFNVNEALNLSKLKEGKYDFVLVAGANEYTYHIGK